MEIWKNITNYNDLYQVSNLGRVKSFKGKKEKILNGTLGVRGYYVVGLFFNNTQKKKYIHQLVAQSFLNHKPCGYKLVVNHKNFIRTDNRVENLEIVTSRENSNRKHLKSTSKYTGVSLIKKTNKWVSRIVINGKQKHLGNYLTELEAHEAYQSFILCIYKFGQSI